MNEEMNKPEWFELTDGDAQSAKVTKVNKKLPIAALLITGAVIATGAFFASASENQASAEGVTQSSASASPSAGTSTVNNANPTKSQPSADVANATKSQTSAPATPIASQAPSIQDPTQGGISAPREHREDDGGDRGGNHEGRENRD
jgi:hypothetical protein